MDYWGAISRKTTFFFLLEIKSLAGRDVSTVEIPFGMETLTRRKRGWKGVVPLSGTSVDFPPRGIVPSVE